jgi:hypothetical protein
VVAFVWSAAFRQKSDGLWIPPEGGPPNQLLILPTAYCLPPTIPPAASCDLLSAQGPSAVPPVSAAVPPEAVAGAAPVAAAHEFPEAPLVAQFADGLAADASAVAEPRPPEAEPAVDTAAVCAPGVAEVVGASTVAAAASDEPRAVVHAAFQFADAARAGPPSVARQRDAVAAR